MTDAFLLISYGAPERKADVVPFLENILHGKNVPSGRIAEVAERYYDFARQTGHFSPLNRECFALIAALLRELNEFGLKWPVYWGNLFWDPLLDETVAEMARQGVKRVFYFITSAFDSPAGNHRYHAAVESVRHKIGPDAPVLVPLPLPFDHSLFIEAQVDRLLDALAWVALERDDAKILFTAHSIPVSDAADSPYESQLLETCRRVVELGTDLPWELVYQSRSGPPAVPWLEPNVKDRVREIAREGRYRTVVLSPIGFFCENFETENDLDLEVGELCAELGLGYARAQAVGSSPKIHKMIRNMIQEQIARS